MNRCILLKLPLLPLELCEKRTPLTKEKLINPLPAGDLGEITLLPAKREETGKTNDSRLTGKELTR